MTLTLLWSEYCAKYEAAGTIPYQHTQFNEKYHAYAASKKTTLRISRKPGEIMEVDWAGGIIAVTDNVTGEPFAAYVFVSCLPCSMYSYAETTPDMKIASWLQAHMHGNGSTCRSTCQRRTDVTETTTGKASSNGRGCRPIDQDGCQRVPPCPQDPATGVQELRDPDETRGPFPPGRVEAACAKAPSYTPSPSLKNVTTVLRNGQNRGATAAVPTATGNHGLTRREARGKGGNWHDHTVNRRQTARNAPLRHDGHV